MKVTEFGIYRKSDGELCYVHYHDPDGAHVVIANIIDHELKLTIYLASSLTDVSPEEKITWLIQSIAIVESFRRGMVLMLADYNGILPDVSQKLVNSYGKHQKRRGIASYNLLLSEITDQTPLALVGFVFSLLKDVLTNHKLEQPTFDEAKKVYVFVYREYCTYPALINTGDDILSLLENLYPGTDWLV